MDGWPRGFHSFFSASAQHGSNSLSRRRLRAFSACGGSTHSVFLSFVFTRIPTMVSSLVNLVVSFLRVILPPINFGYQFYTYVQRFNVWHPVRRPSPPTSSLQLEAQLVAAWSDVFERPHLDLQLGFVCPVRMCPHPSKLLPVGLIPEKGGSVLNSLPS